MSEFCTFVPKNTPTRVTKGGAVLQAQPSFRDVDLEFSHFAVDDRVGIVRVDEGRLDAGVAEHLRDDFDGHAEGDAARGEGVAR